MKIFSFFFYSIVCLVATTLNAPNNVYASNNTIPIGFQFFTASNIPIPNETFQLQLDNEVKYLTTRSDGLAFIEIPSKNIKTQYTLTTSNQQTFTVEPNKLYQLTSSDNQLRNTPTINNQSITIDVLSKTYQPLSNIEVKLLAQNQEFIGKTNNDGTTTINIPSNIPKDTKFNVTINGIDTHSTISIGEDKYYTFNSDNKSVSPFIQDSMQHTQLDNNQQNQQTQANTLNNSNNMNSNQSNSNNMNSNQNNSQTYQISVVKDFLVPDSNHSIQNNNKEKKPSSETKSLPETGQTSSHYFTYIMSALLICITSLIFFIIRKKKSQNHN